MIALDDALQGHDLDLEGSKLSPYPTTDVIRLQCCRLTIPQPSIMVMIHVDGFKSLSTMLAGTSSRAYVKKKTINTIYASIDVSATVHQHGAKTRAGLTLYWFPTNPRSSDIPAMFAFPMLLRSKKESTYRKVSKGIRRKSTFRRMR